jgi:hypothetical protein
MASVGRLRLGFAFVGSLLGTTCARSAAARSAALAAVRVLVLATRAAAPCPGGLRTVPAARASARRSPGRSPRACGTPRGGCGDRRPPPRPDRRARCHERRTLSMVRRRESAAAHGRPRPMLRSAAARPTSRVASNASRRRGPSRRDPVRRRAGGGPHTTGCEDHGPPVGRVDRFPPRARAPASPNAAAPRSRIEWPHRRSPAGRAPCGPQCS